LKISIQSVKELREKTGVGIMDCKNALREAGGDNNKATEGQIQSYVHMGGKIGVLVEVNCETDFSAKTEDFTNFSRNLAMHIAATNPISISPEDLSSEIVEREKEIYSDQALQLGKPEKVVEKIVEGKLKKFYSEACLLNQAYVKDPDITIQDLLNELKAKTGENIIIKRFIRFKLGETDDKA